MNCKQGDLAVILIADDEENIGKLVEVIEFDEIDEEGDFCWLCQSLGSPIKGGAVSYGSGWVEDENAEAMEASIPDTWLRPIRPGELDDETEDSGELEAV